MLRLFVSGGVGLAVFLSIFVAPVSAASPAPSKVIFALDACDPTTFNAAFGAGTCIRGGGVPLPIFLKEVERQHQSPAWRFAPKSVSLAVNEPVAVKNIGGETHTFTEVDAFGGGFVPELNQLAGNLTPVAECSPTSPELNLLPAGGSMVETESVPGAHLYMCCIHPWMHAVLNVKRPAGRGEP
jgi:hypothetical protein